MSFTSLHPQRPFLQIRSPSQVPRVRSWTYLSEGLPFNPVYPYMPRIWEAASSLTATPVPLHFFTAASGPWRAPLDMCESVGTESLADGSGDGGLENGQCQACPPGMWPAVPTSTQDGWTDRRLLVSVPPAGSGGPRHLPHIRTERHMQMGRQPLNGRRSAGPPPSRTFLFQPQVWA